MASSPSAIARYSSPPAQPHLRTQSPTTPMSRQEPSANDITSRVAAASAPHTGQLYPSAGMDFASTGHSVSPIGTNLLA